jgi:hypothetical protein
MMAFALLILISLNIAFLGFVKGYFQTSSDSFLFVGLSYLLVALLSANRFKKVRFTSLANVLGWALSLTVIFFLYNTESLKIYPSDVILAQMISPYLAILWVEKNIFDVRRIKFISLYNLPTYVLITVLVLKVMHSSSEHAWSLAILLILFLMTQVNLREIAKKNLLSGLLSYGNLLVGLALITYLPFSIDSITLSLDFSLAMFLFFSTILIFCLETIFVKVIRDLRPIVSATLISSGLPLSVFYEAVFLSKLNPLEVSLSILYVVSVATVYVKKPLPS